MELKITNRQGETFTVYYDAVDHQKVIERSWYIKKQKLNLYVASTCGKETIRLHRYILGIDDKNVVVGHKNNNCLDNRRDNLVTGTFAEGLKKKRSKKRSTSKYLGVSFSKLRSKWIAAIKVNGKAIYLGEFSNEEDAAKAYDTAAIKHFGNFANPNFKPN